MGMGFAPTWLRQVSPLFHMTTLTTGEVLVLVLACPVLVDITAYRMQAILLIFVIFMLIKDIWFYTADEQGSKQSKANLLTQSNFFFFAYYSSHVFIVMLSNITVPQFVADKLPVPVRRAHTSAKSLTRANYTYRIVSVVVLCQQ